MVKYENELVCIVCKNSGNGDKKLPKTNSLSFVTFARCKEQNKDNPPEKSEKPLSKTSAEDTQTP